MPNRVYKQNECLAVAICYQWQRSLQKKFNMILQSMWHYFVVELCHNDPMLIFWIAPIVVSIILYTVFGLFYSHLDLTGRPAFLARYKVQKKATITAEKYNQIVKRTTINFFIVQLPEMYLFSRLLIWRGCSYSDELPTLFEFLKSYTVSLIVQEIHFYYAHRAFHHPIMYKRFHKIHHELQAPVASASTYCHPLEHLLVNIPMYYLGSLVDGSHASVVLAFGIIHLVIATLTDHSGYHFPLQKSPEFHDYHHLMFNECFGSFGILDWIHGTDIKFRKSKHYQRHRVFFDVEPLDAKEEKSTKNLDKFFLDK